jgi:uncharacterized protein YodC (DUF2158 family)
MSTTNVELLKIQYPEGSAVCLKTGSPELTVEWTRQDGLVAVVWFDGPTLVRDAFHPDALKASWAK